MRWLHTLAALALLALVACGGGAPPATLASIPTYPEARELQAGENAMADAVAEGLRGSVEANLSAELKLYQLPDATSWEQVRSFFLGALEGSDWQASDELGTSAEALSTMGWGRGGGAGEQVLIIGYLPALLGEQPVLIVSLFSE